jgi:hypothetical protein
MTAILILPPHLSADAVASRPRIAGAPVGVKTLASWVGG